MPIAERSINVPSAAGVTVRNRWSRHESPESDRLLVMLPGRNYSCDGPVLFYLREMALRQGFDVLSLTYGFQLTGTSPDMEAMGVEATEALQQAMAAGYRKVCFAGKSLGSPLAAKLAQSLTRSGAEVEVSLILLTPIPGALLPADGVRTMAVIGTADAVFPMDECQAAMKRAKMEWLVLEKLDHGLNHADGWRQSMKSLTEIIEACERFLSGEGVKV